MDTFLCGAVLSSLKRSDDLGPRCGICIGQPQYCGKNEARIALGDPLGIQTWQLQAMLKKSVWSTVFVAG